MKVKSLQAFMEIFAVLGKYSTEGYAVNAIDDRIYINVDPDFVSDEDKEKLKMLGCHVNTERTQSPYNGFYIFN